MTVRLTAAQALVRFLAVQQTERDGERRRAIPAAFGIFGHGNVCGIGQALSESGGTLPLYQPKHEQAMVHTALGYAKATRRLSTLACTASIGPGATNLVTGAATATVNCLPVLLLAGDTFASRRQGPVLQQLQHPTSRDWTVNECLRPVSAFFDHITRAEQLVDSLPEAMRVLFDPAATGAVTLALSQDVQGEAHEFPARLFEPRIWRVPRAPAEPATLAAAAELLRSSQRPLIIAGGGVRHSAAEDALGVLADECGIPVAETSAGKGVFHGELALGGVGVNGTTAANALAAEADVVLCVGTRLTDFTTASRSLFQDPGVRFAAINVAGADANHLGAVPVVGDARSALEDLRRALGPWHARAAHRDAARTAQRSWASALEDDVRPRSGELLGQGQVLRAVNDVTQAGDWVVAAAGSPPGDLLRLWDPPPGSHVHLEFGFSCMGHELPAGLGIRMADRDAGEVFVVIGDGTYLMAPTELVTAAQVGLKVTVVLLVNGGYQSIHGLQRSTLGHGFATEFRARHHGADGLLGLVDGVDYAANARSLGCAAWTVRTADELRAALDAARAGHDPAVIACFVEPLRGVVGSSAWWDLGVPETADDPRVAEHAAAAAAGRSRQRFYG